ncbi:GerAB/ArcD/ProY family transporter [Paenibacillus eucommiae]|uniref:Spore germination protein KB n=1 Tax=Paenibacillus eucommiae TaxID=1355755 RepID=A0ABS4IU59_9BACL|nr:endospore germination permease [Paenibacillus eucommiae]MBP1991118.1 spore germination protein KB [Paenibacillus eucommiae]
MNEPTTISSIQLASLLIACLTGSAIVFIPNPLADVAQNGAWLSLIIAYGFGMLVLACILYLNRVHNGLDLIGYSRLLLGRFLAFFIAVCFVMMLLFSISAVDAGIGDFFTSVMMRDTPSYVFNAMSLLTAALTVRAGVKVIARMFVLLVFIMILFSAAVIIMAVPLYKPEFLLPLFPEGIKPILHGAFIVSGFPFGEVVFFSMILPFVRLDKEATLGKHLYAALTVTGILLTLSTLSTLMAFGPAAGFFKYSLYRLAGEIQIAEVIQRIESVIGIALIVGSYMKATVYLFILDTILSKLFNLEKKSVLIYPITLVCIFLSLTMFKDPSDFNDQVYRIWPFVVVTIGCSVVFLLTIITICKSIFKRRVKAGV